VEEPPLAAPVAAGAAAAAGREGGAGVKSFRRAARPPSATGRRSAEENVLVEQNALAALGLSDHAYVIDLGRTTLSGSGSELLADPWVQEAYLGESVAS
jgi:hypothetical protein